MIHNLYPDKEAAQQVAEAQSGKGPQQPTVTEVKKDAGQPLNTTKTAPPKQPLPQSADKIVLPTHAGPLFNLLTEIRKNPLFRKTNRDMAARVFLADNTAQLAPGAAVPGQLILFNYLEPKTAEELEYYDAGPCTIFFGVMQTDNGPRVLGFNLHYYPPRIRYNVMDKIFRIYKPMYSKYFTVPLGKEIEAFDYEYIVNALTAAKLSFGVRMYIPELMTGIHPIPPNMWATAAFTEGHFRKQTRAKILSYWMKKRGS